MYGEGDLDDVVWNGCNSKITKTAITVKLLVALARPIPAVSCHFEGKSILMIIRVKLTDGNIMHLHLNLNS